jgi:hypothetical protein
MDLLKNGLPKLIAWQQVRGQSTKEYKLCLRAQQTNQNMKFIISSFFSSSSELSCCIILPSKTFNIRAAEGANGRTSCA